MPVNMLRNSLYKYLFLCLLLAIGSAVLAQQQVSKKDSVFFLAQKKGLLGKLGKAISVSGTEEVLSINDGAIKNEEIFNPFKGKVIRQIRVEKRAFSNSVNDNGTTDRGNKKFINDVSDALYTGTTSRTVLRNLFFETGDTLYPFLMADNERFLRELTYLQDARIIATVAADDTTAVDITIRWKDLFPFGGSAEIGSAKSMSLELNDDNLFGSGDRIQFRGLYDMDRRPDWGSGIEYTKRNLGGSFLNMSVGYQTHAPTFNSGRREEKAVYLKGDLPLVSPYHLFTGGFELAQRTTMNSYLNDSIYKSSFKYNFSVVDGWMALNLGARKRLRNNFQTRRRKFIGLRGVQRVFNDIPEEFKKNYNFYYSDLQAVIGSFSFFQQDYYRSNFIYGFGRNEDIPEGFNLSVLGGWVKRNQVARPYIGLDYQRDYFTSKKNYINYILRFGTYYRDQQLEDISGLASMEYFTRLRKMHGEWFNRHFLSASVTQQLRTTFNEPLRLTSIFGIPEIRTNNMRASTRLTFNGESVFYNTRTYFGFRFAPFVFSNVSYLKSIGESIKQGDIFTSFGAGVRSRNENLVFGTMELKIFYYPRTIERMTPWNVTFNTGLRFKYNSQLLKKPDFILVN